MLSLINACMHKYLLSASLKLSGVAAFLSGVISGIFYNCSNDDFSMMMCACPILISAALISVNIGKEHEYSTVRNKLMSGYSKTEVFLSEFSVAMIWSAAVYLVFGLGFSAASPATVFTAPFFPKLKFSFLIMLAALGLSAVFTSISLLITRSVSIFICCVTVTAAVFMTSEVLDKYLFMREFQPEYSYYSQSDPITGEPLTDPKTGRAVSVYRKNPYYISPKKLKALKTVYSILPMGAMDIYCNELYPYIDGDAAGSQRYPKSLPLATAAVIPTVGLVGALLFSKKDIR